MAAISTTPPATSAATISTTPAVGGSQEKSTIPPRPATMPCSQSRWPATQAITAFPANASRRRVRAAGHEREQPTSTATTTITRTPVRSRPISSSKMAAAACRGSTFRSIASRYAERPSPSAAIRQGGDYQAQPHAQHSPPPRSRQGHIPAEAQQREDRQHDRQPLDQVDAVAGLDQGLGLQQRDTAVDGRRDRRGQPVEPALLQVLTDAVDHGAEVEVDGVAVQRQPAGLPVVSSSTMRVCARRLASFHSRWKFSDATNGSSRARIACCEGGGQRGREGVGLDGSTSRISVS